MSKQTAVEWLLEQVNNKGWGNYVISIPSETIQQAKSIEKQQIIDAYHEGTTEFYSAVEYYIETYGK